MTSLLLLSLVVGQAEPAKPIEKKADLPLGWMKARSLGPAVTSGRVVGFAVHPTDFSTYYVAVASGGVWKTVNAGTTWTPIFDGEGSFSIGVVTVDPKNPNVVWVGTGENNSQRSVAYGDGVYKSIDGGRSWSNVGLKQSEHIGKIVIDPRDSDTVYVAAQGPLWGPGGDRGLFKTTDGGKTWAKILNIDEHTGCTDIVQDPRNPDLLIAATYQRRRHVWTLINGGPGSGVHRSTDGGKTWKKVTAGIPGGDVGRIGLAMAPSQPDTLYASIEASERGSGIYRSTDRGATWEKRNPFESGSMYYAHLVVDPNHADRIYVMNVYVQTSDDGGKTLRPLGERSKHVDTHAYWVNPKNSNHLIAGCDGGVYESFDRGATWHFKANLPVTQFYDIAVDQNPASGPFYHVYGGTQDNYTLGGPVRSRSANGIANHDWYVVQGGDGFHCKVDPTDPNTVYGEYQYGGLCRFDRKSGNRVNIQPIALPGQPPLRWNWDSPLIISPQNPKRLYFAANILFRSDNRGDDWKPVSGDLTRQINRDTLPVMGKVWGPDAVAKHQSTSFFGNCVALAESPKKEGLLYVGTDDGLIQVSENGGGEWRKVEEFPGVPKGTYVSKIVASEHDANVVYASFDNHKNADFKPYLLKSSDAGRTWATVAGDLPERGTVYCLAEDPVAPNLLFCGTEFALYVSIDGGKKWTRLRGGLPTIQVKDLVVQKHNADLVVGTFGRGFYVYDDISPLRELSAATTAKPAHLFPVRTAMQYIPSRPFGGGGQAFLGASFFTVENPPVGSAISYFLKTVPKTKQQLRKEAEKKATADKPAPYPAGEELRAESDEEKPTVIVTIKDQTGEVIRTIPMPAFEGVTRTVWDWRSNPVTLAGGGRGGDDGDDDAPRSPRGPMVVPGVYTATIALRAGEALSPLAGPVNVVVTPDALSALKEADYAEIAAHQGRVRQVGRALAAANQVAGELATKLDGMKRAIDLATKPDEATRKQVNESIDKVKITRRLLSGDSFLAGRNENVKTSISQLAGYAASATANAIALPTGTQKTAVAEAAKLLSDVNGTLKVIADIDVPKLEKQLDAIGAPWTPGRPAK
jgi:photosystem II stability/assembly factor-like uncharacterized protein